MTKKEIAQAVRKLDDMLQDYETLIEGNGQCLSVVWNEGGSKIFHSMEQLDEWLKDKERT